MAGILNLGLDLGRHQAGGWGGCPKTGYMALSTSWRAGGGGRRGRRVARRRRWRGSGPGGESSSSILAENTASLQAAEGFLWTCWLRCAARGARRLERPQARKARGASASIARRHCRRHRGDCSSHRCRRSGGVRSRECCTWRWRRGARRARGCARAAREKVGGRRGRGLRVAATWVAKCRARLGPKLPRLKA